MPCWKKRLLDSLPASAGRFFALCFILLPLLALPQAALAGGIETLRAEIGVNEEQLQLAAEFRIELGPRLEEAVMRGVPLHFTLEYELSRPRWYWAPEVLASGALNWRLSYSALTRQYRVTAGGLHRSFATLDEALRAITRVAALPLGSSSLLKPGETYAAAVRLTLDRSQLPKPFQLDALANRDWQADSKVHRWQFALPEAKS